MEQIMDVTGDVKSIIAKVLKIDVGQLKAETKLSDLNADSLDRIEIVFGIEEKFDISIAVELKESSFVLKTGAGQTQELSANTIGEIIQAVQRIVDAKAA